MSLVFHWLADWFLSWAGLSVLVAACAGAVWWLVPPVFAHVRAIAFNVALGALAFNFIYTMGFQNGASSTKAEWDAAEQRAVVQGIDARANAEREIPPVVEQPVGPVCPEPGTVGPASPAAPRARAAPVPVPGWMRDDRNNRDNR